MKYKDIAIKHADELIFGIAPNPVETGSGITIGKGRVYPELNFTLPAISIIDRNMDTIKNHYQQIVTNALSRAVELYSEGVILEFETLIEMTKKPDIGVEIVKLMKDVCENYSSKYGLKSEIRLTPNDLREFDNPPKQRSSSYLDTMLELFERGANAGGNLLSIESTGGKEISDDALMNCDIRQFIFSQAVLGVRDMKMLWNKIVGIANTTNKIPGGDTACGFGNTAMVLAEKKYIPKVFAAIARIATITRSLVAIEEGARGPDKDCGYEGPFLKAITGIPISMEGKSAACAHFSPVGNIAAACADLWSNESVQNVQLLSGMAPTVSLEQLEYDVRLMNQAIKDGKNHSLILRELFVNSDRYFDPQAFILIPENVIKISNAIVSGTNYIDATIKGCQEGIKLIEEGISKGILKEDEKETFWIELIKNDLSSIPTDEGRFIENIIPNIEPGKLLLNEYGL